MKTRIILGVLGLGLALGPSAFAQANALRVYTAVEIEFDTETGKSYTLQGAVGFTNWTDIGNPVLGTGRPVDRILSTRDGGSVTFATYRLQVSDGPTNGYAPWTLTGVHLETDDQSATNVVEYVGATNGHDLYAGGQDPFTVQYSRLSENEGRADRTYSPDRRDSVTYRYSGPGSGNWIREEYEHGVLKNRNVGAFHYVTNDPGTGTNIVVGGLLPPAPPDPLTGMVYYVFTGSVPDAYKFTSAASGVATPGSNGSEGEVSVGGNAFTYAYNVLGTNSASLVVNFGYYGIGGDKQEYDLTYTEGNAGLFNRRIYRLGSLFTTDHGVFSPNAVLSTPGTTNARPDANQAPPTNLLGLTFTMNVGETPRLVFQTTTGGIQFSDSGPSDFSWTYTVTGTHTFALVTRFQPDKWTEYDLTYSNGIGGTFVRRLYDKGELKRLDSGTFTLAPTQ